MFQRYLMSPIILIIIGLAGFGFVFRLITEPMQLFSQLLFMALIAVAFFAIFKFIMQRRMGPGHSSFQRAVRQSKKLHNQNQKPVTGKKGTLNKATQKLKSSKKPLRTLAGKQKNAHNLTVIEGKKGKKKNRALF